MRDVMEKEERVVETGGGLDTGTFSILANGKAFRILIDGLYADKPRAIVRELWSNAYDSHRDAGKGDVPFECHLPTRFAPSFSVRDFGISLSHADIMGLYTTVFKSTKEDSNVGVGKFGLGSKTPFAYTDQFSVTAWKDGRKRIYNAYIDEDSIPKISLFHEEDSDEPTGLEISFGVRPSDVDNFLRAAKTTILGFDVPPILTGAPINVEKDIGKVTFQGSFWRLYASTDRYRSTPITASVRQGCVIYPLDSGALSTEFRKRNIDLSIVESGLIFDVPIGTVDITPSRESLSYDPKTVENVSNYVEKLLKEMVAAYVARINNDKLRLVEFYENYLAVINEARTSLPHSAYRLIEKMAMWRGKSVQHNNLFSAKSVSLVNHPYLKIIHCVNGYRKEVPGRWNDEAVTESIDVNPEYAFKSHSGYHIICQENVEKIPYSGARIRSYMEKISNRCTIFWYSGKKEDLKRLFVLLLRPKNFTVVNLSDLPRPAYAMTPSTTTKEKGTIWVKTFTIAGGINNLKEARVPEKSGGIYFGVVSQKWAGWGVESMDEEAKNNAQIFEPSHWFQILHECAVHGLIENDTPIYIVPRRSRRAVERHSNSSIANGGWVSIMHFLKEGILENVSKEDASKFLGSREKSSLVREIPNYVNDIINCNGAKFMPNSTMGDIVSYFKSLNTVVAATNTAKSAPFVNIGLKLGIYNADVEDIKKVKEEEYKAFRSCIQKIDANYPLLSTCFRYGSSSKSVIRQVIEYIHMVDFYQASKAVEEMDIFPAE
jgi:hypothetical protein